MFYLSIDHIRKKSAITYKKHVRKHYNWQIMCTYTRCTSGASKKHLTPLRNYCSIINGVYNRWKYIYVCKYLHKKTQFENRKKRE